MKVMIDPIDYERNRSKMEYCCSLMLCVCQKILIVTVRNARKVDPFITSYKMDNWNFEDVNLKLVVSKVMPQFGTPDEGMKYH